MPKNKPRVLLVDDSPDDLRILVNCLTPNFQVIAATSGEEAISLCNGNKVDVVVLDVNMPEMDGYELCKRLRNLHQHMQILFLSANDGIDEILQGYDAGGNDYLTKPFSPEILISKIACAIESVKDFERLEKEKRYASDAFMTAITSLGDLGNVITFLRDCFQARTSQALAGLLVECLASYDLQCSIQLRSELGIHNVTSSGDITPLEIELLNRIATIKDRFFENGKRLFINYESVSVLIKNMPTDDDERKGRLRDTLAILVESTNDKQLSLAQQYIDTFQLRQACDDAQQLLNDTEAALQFIKTVHQELKHANVNLLEAIADQIQDTYVKLCFSDKQETKLTSLLTKGKQEASALFNESILLEEQISALLQKLAVRQHSLGINHLK